MQMIHSFSLNNPWFQLALPLLVLLYNVINDSRVLCVSLSILCKQVTFSVIMKLINKSHMCWSI